MGSYTHNKIFELANHLEPVIIKHRRNLHQNPELSFKEFQTSAYIQHCLKKLDIPFKVLCNTGVVGQIGTSHQCVALRADIDALPIEEETGLEFASKNSGVMHACGHDAHTAMLLGAAQILKTLEKDLKNSIKLIFQPGEEELPGGASLMIAQGVLENPRPKVIFGQHLDPEADSEIIRFIPGSMTSSSTTLDWKISGKGGHAALPHQSIDPILIAIQIISQLYQIIPRAKNPLEPSVLTIATINAGHTHNVIPESATFRGTLRTFDTTWEKQALEKIHNISTSIAESLGGKCVLQITPSYPTLINDNATTAFAEQTAQELFGPTSTERSHKKLYAEDFAYYAQQIPACFWTLGVKPKSAPETFPGLHNPHFTPEESAFKFGSALLAGVGLKWEF